MCMTADTETKGISFTAMRLGPISCGRRHVHSTNMPRSKFYKFTHESSCAGSPTTVVIRQYLYRVQNFTKKIHNFFTNLILHNFYIRKYILLIEHIGHDYIKIMMNRQQRH